jgi:hypothetical protein
MYFFLSKFSLHNDICFWAHPAQAPDRAIRYNNAAWRCAPGGVIPLLSLARFIFLLRVAQSFVSVFNF